MRPLRGRHGARGGARRPRGHRPTNQRRLPLGRGRTRARAAQEREVAVARRVLSGNVEMETEGAPDGESATGGGAGAMCKVTPTLVVTVLALGARRRHRRRPMALSSSESESGSGSIRILRMMTMKMLTPADSLLGSFVKVKRHVLNSHLVCTICNGYFRTRTQCKNAFTRFVKSVLRCTPSSLTTNAQHVRPPFNMQDVRPDHTLQSLVGKLYPEYGPSADAAAKIAFYEARGIKRKVREFRPAASNPAQIARPPPSAAAQRLPLWAALDWATAAPETTRRPTLNGAVSETAKSGQTAAISNKTTIDLTKFKAEDDNFNALNDEELAIANFAIDDAEELPFRLVPDKSVCPGLRLADLDKPFLCTSSELTVKMLIKFLRHKVAKKEDSAGIELTSLVSTNLTSSNA